METLRRTRATAKWFAHSCPGKISILLAAIVFLGAWLVNAQSPITIQTVAELRAYDTIANATTNDTVAYVIDYYALSGSAFGEFGHRGGGHFRFVKNSVLALTNNDDGGKYISANPRSNGLWFRVLDGGTPNVKMWGAHGDGWHNDTAAVQNAVRACENWGAGGVLNAGELLFPAGIYVISNTIVFNASLLHLRGEGPRNTSVQMALGVSKDIFRTSNANDWITTGSGDFDHGLLFENLQVGFQDDGSTNGHPSRNKTNAGLVVGYPGEVSTIRNVELVNGGYGIRCLGGGAPGLNVRDVKCSDPAMAGIFIEPLPTESMDVGGPITIMGLSGDQIYGDAAAKASLVLISNVESEVSITSVKAEGDWGGGLIHYYSGANDQKMEHLYLRELNYNAGYTIDGYFFPPDLLKIDKSPLFTGCGPVVSIQQVRLFAVLNLIHDLIGGRIVESDVENNSQITALLPITYQANATGGGGPATNNNFHTGSSLFVGETAITTFYATNTGWYRILATYGGGRPANVDGRVSITSPYSQESIEMQVSTSQFGTPWINVTRCRPGTNIVSQARAIQDYPHAYVDIFVTNAIPASQGPAARLTVTLDTGGQQLFGALESQLLAPPLPVSKTPPSGSVVTTVNTYR